MSYVMKVEDGAPVGQPMRRPSMVTLDSGHTVACGHWSDADLAEIAGLYPVVNGYNPSNHVATGGGQLVDGGVAVAYQERPIAALQAERISALKAECSRRILATWPDYKQRSAALGVYGAEAATACAKWIADHIAACDAAEAAIRACATAAGLDALPAPKWPEEV